MNRRRLEGLLWALALLAVTGGWLRWRHAAPPAAPATASSIPPAPAVPDPPLAGELQAGVRAVRAGDVFRLDRVPPPVAFAAAAMPGGPMPPPAPPPFRPQLRLSGVVGPPWQAFLEGVPGRSGTVVVQRGDTLAGLRVRSIAPNLVVVQGADTTWRLTLRKP